MRTVKSIAELGEHGFTDIATAIGVFDGVHRGHQQIISALIRVAEESGASPVVLTFHPHPRAVLCPSDPPALLTTREQQSRALRRLGVEAVVLLAFSRDFARLPPEAFVRHHLLAAGVRVRGVCVGETWRFGAAGAGDTEFLAVAGREHGFRLESVPEFLWYGRPVSSTRVREAIKAGRLDTARRMLGRPYAISGVVARGEGLGRRVFSCPTANVSLAGVVAPPCGVYAARCRVGAQASASSETCYGGIAYIGTAPTMRPGGQGGAPPLLELHVFGFEGDLYGMTVETELVSFLRPDRTFASAGELGRQIRRDLRTAEAVLGIPG